MTMMRKRTKTMKIRSKRSQLRIPLHSLMISRTRMMKMSQLRIPLHSPMMSRTRIMKMSRSQSKQPPRQLTTTKTIPNQKKVTKSKLTMTSHLKTKKIRRTLQLLKMKQKSTSLKLQRLKRSLRPSSLQKRSLLMISVPMMTSSSSSWSSLSA